MKSASTLDFHHPPGSFRAGRCGTVCRLGRGRAGDAGGGTARFAEWGQDPMNRETGPAPAPFPPPARGENARNWGRPHVPVSGASGRGEMCMNLMHLLGWGARGLRVYRVHPWLPFALVPSPGVRGNLR
jgi:hypothetical protein